jgi:hypothetical protein
MQDPKEPLYIPGDLVTRNNTTSFVLVYEIDEVLASGDTFLYHLKPYKEDGDRRGAWDKESAITKAIRKPLVEKIQDAIAHTRDVAKTVKETLDSPLQVCIALCRNEVLSGEKSVLVEIDNTPTVEYRFKPVGAVNVLFARNLDLGLAKSFWHEVSVITDQGLMAECRTVDQKTMRLRYREALEKTEGTRVEAYERLKAAGINADNMTKQEMIDAAIKLLDQEG